MEAALELEVMASVARALEADRVDPASEATNILVAAVVVAVRKEAMGPLELGWAAAVVVAVIF